MRQLYYSAYSNVTEYVCNDFRPHHHAACVLGCLWFVNSYYRLSHTTITRTHKLNLFNIQLQMQKNARTSTVPL